MGNKVISFSCSVCEGTGDPQGEMFDAELSMLSTVALLGRSSSGIYAVVTYQV